MTELNQLLLKLDHKTNFNEYDFYLSKSNSTAFNLVNKWPDWAKKILNISGEKFSGKSHLANIFKSKSKAFFIEGKNIDNSVFKSLKLYETIIIDDFDECNEEEILYSIFNLIDQDNKYMLINSLKPISEIKFKLPDLASRAKNCIYAEIENPDDELLFAIILKNFSDRQIKIEKKIINFIISRIDRSYRKIDEFIYKIDELSLKKKKPITFNTIKEIL